MEGSLNIALIAGEASGDQLGGKLIEALRRFDPNIRCYGIGGKHMRAAGFETWWDRDELSIMGLSEVLRHLPRLLKLRRALVQRLLEERPDVVIGIDAPDFNLGLEMKLRKAGMTTVHYVSPTVWAWREGRVSKIARAADLVLCLFPFEPPFYAGHGVRAAYTGHPMADAIDNDPDRLEARQALKLDSAPDTPVLALLPGSRGSEVTRLAVPMLEAAQRLSRREGGIRPVAALADERTAALFREQLAQIPGLECDIIVGRALEVMAASDVVVCASGTATLEAMLVNRPLVVTYRLSPSTHWVMKNFKLMNSEHIALPNILAGEGLVPELIQDDASGERIAEAVEDWLTDPQRREAVHECFATLHRSLRQGAANQAAEAVLKLLEAPGAERP